MTKILRNPGHVFGLDYLVDNGRLSGWATDYEQGCVLVQWRDEDNSFSVLDATDSPIGWGETAEDAMWDARCHLTNVRRERDGVKPARVC